MKYVSLHHHTTFSYMDGYGMPEAHVARAAELGMGAIAHTEHGNMSSHVKLEAAAKAAGIQPIYGVELYTANGRVRDKWHLTVLAENEVGYRNLMRIVTASWGDNFYYWPTTPARELFRHSEGLIVLSGCAHSKLACDILGGKGVPEHPADLKAGLRTAQRFRDALGDRYYLEMQAFPELERSRTLNQVYGVISARLGIPMAVTSDVHYPRPGDNEMQKILHTAGRGLSSLAEAEAAWEYDIRLTMPESDADVLRALEGTGLARWEAEAALAGAVDVAARCRVSLPRAGRVRADLPDGSDAASALLELARAGWRRRMAQSEESARRMRARSAEYAERLSYEMSLITLKDFADYFLVLAEAIGWAKSRDIGVGPARGSAAASLVCWLTGITEIDPMRYPTMLFDRFIDATREDLPDVDIDFSDSRRDEVFEHIADKYGSDRVGMVASFTRYRGKNSVDDVARATGIPVYDAAALKEMIVDRGEGDDRFETSLSDTFEMLPKARDFLTRYPQLRHAVALEGNIKGFGVHAAGLVLSPVPMSEVAASYQKKIGKGQRVAHVLAVDKWDCETLGLLKMDFLGLTTMGMIDLCRAALGMSLDDLYSIPLDDEDAMRAFRSGDVIGIFQWDGQTTKNINAAVAPDTFMELADINALSRPGALFSGATAAYIDAKKTGKVSTLHPLVDQHTGITKGQIVYQEQVLAIIRDVGKFAPHEVNTIRKIIGKKKGPAEFNKLKSEFLAGAKAQGINAALGAKIWDFLVTSAGYSFNVAHSVSYATLAFWCQWLKQHHPVEFYWASLRKVQPAREKETVPRLVNDAARHGVDVMPCSLGSGVDWRVRERTLPERRAGKRGRVVEAGFRQAPGIGEKIAEAIVADRQANGAFSSVEDLARVKGMGPKKLDGVRDFIGNPDPYGIQFIRRVCQFARKRVRELSRESGGEFPAPSHTSAQVAAAAPGEPIAWLGFTSGVSLIDELEAERKRSGLPIEKVLEDFQDPEKTTSARLRGFDDGDDPVTLRVNRWNFERMRDELADVSPGDLVLAEGVRQRGVFSTIKLTSITVVELGDGLSRGGGAE